MVFELATLGLAQNENIAMSHDKPIPQQLENPQRQWSDFSDQQLIDIAQQWMDALMQASTELDYVTHTLNWSQRARSVLNAQQFEQICRQYQAQKGYFTERRFLGMLRRPHSVLLLWSQQFSKILGEHVVEMVLIMEDNTDACQLKIDHVMVCEVQPAASRA